MFGKKRKYKKAIGETLGPNIHRQIRDALTSNPQALTTPEQMAFTAGYLRTSTIEFLRNLDCEDPHTWNHMQKFLCEGVMPGKLWEIVERALGLIEVDPELLGAYNHGQETGIKDSYMKLDLLTTYLLGDEVEHASLA